MHYNSFVHPLYTDFLFDFHKKFQERSRYDTNIKYKIWIFCYKLFSSYAENTHIHPHRLITKNIILTFRTPQIAEIHENIKFKNLTETYYINQNTFSHLMTFILRLISLMCEAN